MSSSTQSTETLPEQPRAFEPRTLIVTVALSVLGAFIGLHLITSLGISANTSVIGALVAMTIGRIGIWGFHRFRDVERQNLAQTAISAATFGAANALLTPIAIGWAFGRPDLVWPLLLGAGAGMIVDAWILYRTFGSRFLPATGTWPQGIAAAEVIKAGDEGGRRATILLGGGAVGAVIAWFGLSASAAGVALIGNVVALLMFGIGLMINQYSPMIPGLENVSLSEEYIPHGIMIGAGVVALIQAVLILTNRRARKRSEQAEIVSPDGGTPAGASAEVVEAGAGAGDLGPDPALADSRTPRELGRGFGSGFAVFIGVAIVLAVVSGVMTEMSVPALIGWVLFAAVAAFVSEIIVGLAAMHSGWFPAFAVTLIFLVVGLIVGLPEVPLVVLVGYCAATGPAFADMGYDLKAGWVLRRIHSRSAGYRDYERSGRKQQYYSALIGFVVALVVVALLWESYFEDGLIPPVAVVYADTITAGLTNPDAVRNLLLWAIPGALIQLLGGSSRQMGILLATGLLISAPHACWLVFGALLIRVLVRRYKGKKAEEQLHLVGAGIIAGDAIASLGSVFRN